MNQRNKWTAPNGWYKRSPLPRNGASGNLTDDKIMKYALKGFYGESMRRMAEAEKKRLREASKLAEKEL